MNICFSLLMSVYLMFTEELKRVNSSIDKAFDEKLKLVSKISNIPAEEISQESSQDSTSSASPKDAKDLVCGKFLGNLECDSTLNHEPVVPYNFVFLE